MKNQLSKETLLNYFAGQATALQKQAIDEWVKEATNQEVFYEYLALWESQHPQFTPNASQALQRHQHRMANRATDIELQQNTNAGAPVTRKLNPVRFWWMVAASVSIVCLLGGVFFNETILYVTHKTTFGETRTVILTDGSQVTLNANSMLRVPRFGFGKQTRDVVLAGEADFSIKHLPDNRRFVVHTDKNFEVVVLGTEFLVNTRERGTKVVLNQGKVRLNYQEGQTSRQLTMKPGNLVTFDRNGHVSLKQTTEPKVFTSWKEHRFVFDETTLMEISNLFAENYGITLQIPDQALTRWTISGAFTAYSAEELIETLTTASSLTYRRQGNTIVITEEH
jgi:transmembrane sensor